MDYIKREIYLEKLINRMNNGEVKIITGPRRVGKSWLLSHIFYDYLLSQGVDTNHIIHISFDMDDEIGQNNLLELSSLKEYIYDRIKDKNQYYIMLDEIQEIEGFERLINGLNAKENIEKTVKE